MSTVAENVVSALPKHKLPQRPRLTALCLAGSDAVAVALAVAVGLLLSHLWIQESLRVTDGLTVVGATLLVFTALGLYTIIGLSPVQEFQRVLLGSSIGYGVMVLIFFSRLHSRFAQFIFTFAWATIVLLVPVCREILRHACYEKPWWGTPAVIFGSGNYARSILRSARIQPSLGLKIVGIFDNDHRNWKHFDRHRIHVGTLSAASDFVESSGVQHAVIAMSNKDANEMEQLIRKHARSFRFLLVVPEVAGISSMWVEPRDLGGVLGLHVRQNLMRRNPRIMKRLFDIVLTSFLLIALSPLFVLIYIAIRLSSRGPVFYGQTRIGHEGETFKAWKFRSMLPDAEAVLRTYFDQHPELRTEWERDCKLKHDPRITRVGRLLRRTSLDELPQLWNVLIGEMSLVGPRPILVEEVPRYSEIFESYKSVRPGITGMWQVSGRNNTTYEERLRLVEYYVRNWSVWLDLYILARTCKIVLIGEGAC